VRHAINHAWLHHSAADPSIESCKDADSMDSGTFNKWAGAILSALLMMFGLRTLVHEMRHEGPPTKAGYEVASLVEGGVPAEPAPPAVAEPPIAELLKVADAGVGQAQVKACQACHSFEKGCPNKVGPHLWGVVNRPVGSSEGFSYSEALKAYGGNWDYAKLNEFLTNPKLAVKGTKMAYAGIKKGEDRAAVIAYLRSLADTPAPLP
jgi:cytochrome c